SVRGREDGRSGQGGDRARERGEVDGGRATTSGSHPAAGPPERCAGRGAPWLLATPCVPSFRCRTDARPVATGGACPLEPSGGGALDHRGLPRLPEGDKGTVEEHTIEEP